MAFYNEDIFWSSPALADLTGDGLPEIITGANIYRGNVWDDPIGGYLYVFDAVGNTLAREWMDQDIYSSPAVADLDNDGAIEIVVGTGIFVAGKGYYVSAFEYDPNPSNPTDRLVLKWRQPTVGRIFASPALGDLNKDGWLDVVITVPKGDNGPDGTFVYARRGRDGAPLFQRRACDMWGNSFNTLSSPIIADVDGDSWSEILFSHVWEVAILNHDGTYYTDYSNPKGGAPEHPGCSRDHTPTTNLSYWAEYTLYATPAVGDLDGDGDAEIVIGGHNPDNTKQGMLFVWTGHHVDEWPSWPTWRHDVAPHRLSLRHPPADEPNQPQQPIAHARRLVDLQAGAGGVVGRCRRQEWGSRLFGCLGLGAQHAARYSPGSAGRGHYYHQLAAGRWQEPLFPFAHGRQCRQLDDQCGAPGTFLDRRDRAQIPRLVSAPGERLFPGKLAGGRRGIWSGRLYHPGSAERRSVDCVAGPSACRVGDLRGGDR